MPDRTIEYLSSQQIDREKWDRCIASAPNGLIFSTSIYLDMLTDHWNAVIVGDYEAVMPLPWRKKLFVKYHYHVPFIPQAGLTGVYDDNLSKVVAKLVLRKIPFGDLLLNYGNTAMARYLRAVPLTNLVLDLSVQFPHIHKKYHHDLENNLRRAARHDFKYGVSADVKTPITLFRKLYGSRLRSVRASDFDRFTSLCLHLYRNNQAFIRKVTDVKGKLLAAVLLLRDDRRIYNMINSVTPEGRKKSANHFLYDQLMREFAGQALTFDFEGSRVPGIRRFYENFGAENQPYYWSRRIPWSL